VKIRQEKTYKTIKDQEQKTDNISVGTLKTEERRKKAL